MKNYGLNELREKFLAFFESKDHLRLPSFSLVPNNDASLLLINSGMAPMKLWFKGDEEPPSKRICTCQKCIRTGDIDNIGQTARHGTYFEMLGNFSFGDYFKKESISWSWEFLTSKDWLGIDPDKLYPSVYLEDDEAADIWHNDIGIPVDRIFRFGKADNFWEHGTGPCGPCSEIYFDRGEKYGCGKPDCTVGCECDRYIEIWNNVFTQFDNKGDGIYTELSQKNIDTGMGLERLAVVCQDVYSLFDVDTVMNITNKVSEITGAKYGQSKTTDVSLRVITDHIRSGTMMICDGVLPSNEGRGYVLRRLLRRAARHGKLLGINEPFLFAVCATVIAENKSAYPELVDKQDYITRVIRIEEENFAKTIDSGMKILSDILDAYKNCNTKLFSGDEAFRLYDTYGFPIDLTAEIVAEHGLEIDRSTFASLMEEQRVRAREARAAMGDLAWAGIDLGLDNTPTEFDGYDKTEAPAKVLAVVVGENLLESATEGDDVIIVLDRTPFYAEMGGQAADHGTIVTDLGEVEIHDVQKNKTGKYLHHGIVLHGEIRTGDAIVAKLDMNRRRAIMRAHSATHLLHKALRTVLGEHVEQAGSLVEPDRVRFDFTHFSAIEPKELAEIERIVNTAVLDGMDIGCQEMSMADAKEKGALALFSEKYGDTVRVISMGDFSVELCGGTHLDNTAKAGPFRIRSEFSVASGVRRIEALVGEALMDDMRHASEILRGISDAMKTNTEGVSEKFEQFMQELKTARKMLEKLQAQQLSMISQQVMFGAKTVEGLKIITAIIPDKSADELRQMGDMLRDRDATIVAVLASSRDGKNSLAAVCGDVAVERGIRAGDLIKHITSITGGSGGGKPERAMGGAKEANLLDNAFATIDTFVSEHVK